MDYAKIAIEKHKEWKGKIQVVPELSIGNKR